MKKLGKLLFALVLTLGLFTNVNAMTKDELKTKLTKNYTIAGKSVSISANDKVNVERYLSINDVSSKDADYISGKVDEAVAILNNAGTTDRTKLSKADKNKLKQLVADISNNTSVKATVLSGGYIEVYNLDGTLFTKIAPTIIQQTSSSNLVITTGSISLIGIALALVALNKKKVNA